MNNALLLKESPEEVPKDAQPVLRERMEKLVKIIEALQKLAGSEYWAVLRQNVFGADISKAKRLLAKEKDTTEIFRLQGELRWEDKINLEKQITKYRSELETIRKKLNG